MQPSTHISEKAIKAISKLGKLYEVGGAVRDDLLGLEHAGYDRDYLVTGVKIDDLIGELKKSGRVDVVGKSFGVIKYTEFEKAIGANGESISHTFDIALPRVETSHGHGHKEFAVEYDPDIPIEEDLGRRDFTVNAMARSVTGGEVIDPYGGQKDLKEYTLRMVTENSFAEDPLRMLRGAQFAARFNLLIEDKTWNAMRHNAELVKTISAERIAEELNKLLTKARRPSAGFRIMQETGLLEYVIPELLAGVDCDQPGGFHRWNVFEHTLRVVDAAPQSLNLRLACLFHDINKPQCKRASNGGATFYGHESAGAVTSKKIMKRLRYSHELTDQVVTLVERHMFTTAVTDKGLRRLVRKVGQDLIFDLLDLRRADVAGQGMGGSVDDVDEFEAEIRAELERKPPFGRSDLALNGTDLMRLFELPPGPFLGEILDDLMEKVLDNPLDNTPERMAELAREFLERSGRAC